MIKMQSTYKKLDLSDSQVVMRKIPEPRRAENIWETLIGSVCKQTDFESPRFRQIANHILKQDIVYERKLWEFVYIIHMLQVAGVLGEGMKGLGFGCGREPLVPAFAKLGCKITATDLGVESAEQTGWAKDNQYAVSLESFGNFIPSVCPEEKFYENTMFQAADMNDIPAQLRKSEFDFVWSSCAMEHLGSLRAGMEFVKNTLECLKPGGVSVHTTEFNVQSNEATLEDISAVAYRRRDLLELKNTIELSGGYMYPIDFTLGDMEFDHYVDLPPYNRIPAHLRFLLGEFALTSIGIVITKKQESDDFGGKH